VTKKSPLLRALLAEGLPAVYCTKDVAKVGDVFAVAHWKERFYVNDTTKRAGPLLFSSKDFSQVVRWLRDKLGCGPYSSSGEVSAGAAPVLVGGKSADGPAA
jgi:hypothetical protein